MGTKNKPGEFDCYANAEPDEPMFVLLGRDRHAPALVWLWAVLRELDGEKPEVVHEARECVAEMMAWAFDHGRKSVGVAQSVLAGVMEMIRAVNHSVKDAKNAMTTVAEFRQFMCAAQIEPEPPKDAAKPGG